MRKAMALLEILVAMFVLSFLMLIVVGPTRRITVEIPRMTRDFEVDSILGDVVNQIRQDVESASAIIDYPGNESVLGRALVIQTPQGEVLYYIADGEIIRHAQGGETEFTWKVLSTGRLDWEIWYDDENDEDAAAVLVTRAVARKIAGKVRQRLVNSHVFFVGAVNATGGKI